VSPKSKNVLDKYRVIAKLGRGGMADVFLATAVGPGDFSKLLVVKVLQETLARDENFLVMFRDEARLAARLNHPNIVQTYEVGQSEGRHYIAMEYLEGQPLNAVSEAMSAGDKRSVSSALRIIMDALSGLHYAHEVLDFDGRPLGVVHRDITPQNVFVTYEGQVKIVDFGIAKALDSSSETKVGTVKGKVSYMAPEQARGETVTRTADIFSMAVLLWELLSDQRLWEGLTDIAVVGRLMQGDIPDIARLRPDLSPELAGIIMRALSPDQNARPQTALQFQELLEQQFEKLDEKVNSRKLGEFMRGAFSEQRAQARGVVAKQLERLARRTPSGETPPGGWKLGGDGGAGDMPILGEGSKVHDAVTTIHTGLTGAPATLVTSAHQAHSGVVTGVTDAGLITQNRRIMWVAIAAVGIAGLSLGAARPWQNWGASSPTEISTEVTSTAAAAAEASLVSPAANPTEPARDGATHAVRTGCDSARKPLVELTGEITGDAELSCDKDYLLRFTTYVAPGSTLSIEPGTRLMGDVDTKGVLVVQPGARIEARGTAHQPIVFTSSNGEGRRKPGDWGGLILLGNAPINLKNAAGKTMPGHVEGISTGGEYGGDNEQDSSGTLSHVRIEYSGTEIGPNNEINGLTLAGVGRGTVLDHIQVRHTADDCFEFFGGTVDGKYLVCQSPGDDAFDWDYGYTGRLQFLLAQANPKAQGGANGFEGDNDPNGTKNGPVSHPAIYNATLCGKNRRMESKEHYGLLLRRGSELRMRNTVIQGFGAGMDVRDEGTKPNIAASVFHQNLVYNLAYPENTTATKSEKLLFDDDGGFDELIYLRNPGLRISEVDPGLGNCFDPYAPSFKPRQAILKNAAIPPDDDFFDANARYVGAFRDIGDDWDRGEWLRWGK